MVNLNIIAIPTTLSEALSKKKRKQATNVEMETLEVQHVGVDEIASRKETSGV